MAFFGNTAAMANESITEATPTPAVRLNADLPSKFEEIINKALEKDRGLRYNSAAELRTDLKRLNRDRSSGKVPRGSGDLSASSGTVAELAAENRTDSVVAPQVSVASSEI